jgi:DNA-binding beta-propeller fold protein YncE
MGKLKLLVLAQVILISMAPPLALFAASSPAALRQIALLDLPGTPGFDDMVMVNGSLVIAHHGANTVDIFDPVKRRMVAQIRGIESPRGLAVDERGGVFYIAASGSNTIVVVNSKTWQVLGVMGLKHSPENLLLVPGMNSLLITNPLNRSVSVVSTENAQKIAPTSPSELATFDLQGRPREMAWDPQKKVAYVTLEDTNEIVALDPENAGNPVARRIKLTASQPTGIVFEQNSRRIFVAVRYAVLQIDADSGTELSRVPAAAGTDTLWLDLPNNNLLAAAGDGSVSIINIGAYKIEARNEFKSDVRGHALAYDAVNHLIFLSGGREGKSKLVIIRNSAGAPTAEETVARKR